MHDALLDDLIQLATLFMDTLDSDLSYNFV